MTALWTGHCGRLMRCAQHGSVSSHIIYLCCPWIMKVTSLPDGTLAAEHYLTNSVNGKLNGLLGHEIV